MGAASSCTSSPTETHDDDVLMVVSHMEMSPPYCNQLTPPILFQEKESMTPPSSPVGYAEHEAHMINNMRLSGGRVVTLLFRHIILMMLFSVVYSGAS